MHYNHDKQYGITIITFLYYIVSIAAGYIPFLWLQKVHHTITILKYYMCHYFRNIHTVRQAY
jgi:hypothetical protein